jgi:ABC-2 type transport system ATP-binding protein
LRPCRDHQHNTPNGRPTARTARPVLKKALLVKTAEPLAHPERVFVNLPGAESWHADEDGGYVVSVSDPSAAAPELTRALVRAGADVLAIGESRHSLEDVYLELIEDDVEAQRR